MTPRTIVHGILQARIMEWVAFPFSRESSQPRDWTQVSTLWADSLPAEPQGKPKNTGGGSLSLLQWIFPTQASNQGLLHCRWILYQLSYEGSPYVFFKIFPKSISYSQPRVFLGIGSALSLLAVEFFSILLYKPKYFFFHTWVNIPHFQRSEFWGTYSFPFHSFRIL